MSGIDIEKVKEELLHDKNFLLQIESSMKRMDEKTVCEPREDGGMEESESGLDMDVDMMLAEFFNSQSCNILICS